MGWFIRDLVLENERREIVGPLLNNEDALAWFYLRMKQADLLQTVFYQGEQPTVREFIDWYGQGAGKEVIAALGSDGTLLGLGFTNTSNSLPGLRISEVGFCFLPPLSPFKQADFIKAMISYLFIHSNVDSIVGTTPDRNPGAVAIIKRVGMRLFGPIPNYTTWHGEPCGVWTSQTDRAHWFNGPGASHLITDVPSST